MTCTISGCDNSARYKATGWCGTHYHRYWRTGSTDPAPKALRADLTYFGAHGRVKAFFGSATRQACVQCGNPADEWAYDGTDPSELSGLVGDRWPVTYSVWPEFYKPMCFGCHRAFDAGKRYESKTHFGCGHERGSNAYHPPGKPRAPECRTCRAEKSRVRYQERRLREDTDG